MTESVLGSGIGDPRFAGRGNGDFTTEITELAEAKTYFLCSLRYLCGENLRYLDCLRYLNCLRYRILTSVSNRLKFVYVACPSMRVRPVRYSSFMSSGRNMSNRALCV